MKFKCLATFIITSTLLGCANMSLKKNVLMGVGGGAITGSGVGAITNKSNRKKSALIGGAIGGLVGGSISYFLHKHNSKIAKRNLHSSILEIPKIILPKARAEWIPKKQDGKILTDGHFRYIIEEEVKWAQE